MTPVQFFCLVELLLMFVAFGPQRFSQFWYCKSPRLCGGIISLDFHSLLDRLPPVFQPLAGIGPPPLATQDPWRLLHPPDQSLGRLSGGGDQWPDDVCLVFYSVRSPWWTTPFWFLAWPTIAKSFHPKIPNDSAAKVQFFRARNDAPTLVGPAKQSLHQRGCSERSIIPSW